MSAQNDDLEDQVWLALLQGKTVTPISETDGQQVKALRQSITDWYRREIESDEQSDQLHQPHQTQQAQLEQLLFRLRAEGLLQAPARKKWQAPPKWFAFAASVAAITVSIGISMQMVMQDQQGNGDGVMYRGVKGAQQIKAKDPEQVLQRFQQEYDRLGITSKVQRTPRAIIIDASIPSEAEQSLKALFDAYKIKPNSNGQLLVEIHR